MARTKKKTEDPLEQLLKEDPEFAEEWGEQLEELLMAADLKAALENERDELLRNIPRYEEIQQQLQAVEVDLNAARAAVMGVLAGSLKDTKAVTDVGPYRIRYVPATIKLQPLRVPESLLKKALDGLESGGNPVVRAQVDMEVLQECIDAGKVRVEDLEDQGILERKQVRAGYVTLTGISPKGE